LADTKITDNEETFSKENVNIEMTGYRRGFITITTDELPLLISSIASLLKDHPKMQIIRMITPYETYKYDPVTFIPFETPKNYPKYGCLIEHNSK
jgi:hypothetical protein